MSVEMIINIILCIGVVLSYLAYRNIKNRQNNDPEYQRKLRDKQKKKSTAGDDLEEYLSKADNEDSEE